MVDIRKSSLKFVTAKTSLVVGFGVPTLATVAAMVAYGLADRRDVRLVEAAREGRAAVPGGAKGDALARHAGVWNFAEVAGDEARNGDEDLAWSGLAGEWVHSAKLA